MLAPFRDPTYGRRNRITAAVLATVALGTLFILLVTLGLEGALSVVAVLVGLVIFDPMLLFARGPSSLGSLIFSPRATMTIIEGQEEVARRIAHGESDDTGDAPLRP